MLVNCKPGCSGKKGTTEVLLDEENDAAVCVFCQEEVNISSFAKKSMKQRKEILKPAKKSFMFSCEICNKSTKIVLLPNGNIVGEGCKRTDCKFNISSHFIHALTTLNKQSEQQEKSEIDDE